MKNKIIKFILTFTLVLSTIISIIDFCCFDHNFYHSEYTKLNNAIDIGVSDSDLNLMTDVLLDYLKGDKENLDIQVKVNGTLREVYNQREKIHMYDVKVLYDNVICVRNISLIIFSVSLLYLLINKDLKNIKKEYLKTLFIFLFVFSFIGLMCLIDFNTFWTNFHLVFFDNDYWLLDPRTSILINMVPEQFFYDLCIRIVLLILIFLVLYYLLFKYLDKRIKND